MFSAGMLCQLTASVYNDTLPYVTGFWRCEHCIPAMEHRGAAKAHKGAGGGKETDMKFYDVSSEEFREYGRVIEGCEVSEILRVLKERAPVPEDGTVYVPKDDVIQSLEEAKRLALTLFGGVPCEFGYCSGHNTKMNCMEYHRCSEFNLGTEDAVLLLAKQQEIEDGILDTAKVKAFLVPAGTLVEVYATTLHYAPCHADADKGFQMLVVLSDGTNTERPDFAATNPEDAYLTAANKWLLAHEESPEAASGAKVGLKGVNIDISE